MRPFSEYVAGALCLTLICVSIVQAEDTNLVFNPGFELPSLDPWIVSPEQNFGVSSGDSVEGTQSMFVDHLGIEQTTEVSFTQNVGQQNSVVAGNEYIFSINAKVESGDGQIILFASFDKDPSTAQDKIWDVNGVTNWQKYQFKIFVPNNADQIRIGCFFSGTSGRNWMDWAQLFDINNLVHNGDFEIDGYWNLNDGTINSEQQYFGSQSLSIPGYLNQIRWASQYVDLSTHIDQPDQPMYTISAHVKTEVEATSTYEPPVFECNSDDFDEDLDPVYGSGAQIQIICYQSDTELRRLYMPFYESHCDNFVERKFSFLVPEHTDALVVAFIVFDAEMTAFFDNVRLTYQPLPLIQSYSVEKTLGHKSTVVEAPEPGTFVAVDGLTDAELDDAISEIADFGSPNYGKTVWVPSGEYLIERIIPCSRLHLKMHHQAFLRRDPTGTDGFRGSLIRNDELHQFYRVSDVIVEGGHYLRAFESGEPDNNNVGNVVALYGDRIVFRNFYIPEWSQTTKWEIVDETPVAVPNSDIALSFLGHDLYVYHNSISGPAGNLGDGSGLGGPGFDGIHCFGGERSHFMGNRVFAGDDGVGLYTGTIPFRSSFCGTERKRLYIYNRNIRDVEIFNNRLSSNWGRAVSCGLARPRSDEADLTAIVENVRARNIVGRHGGLASSLSVICNPRRPIPIYPGDQCPSPESAAQDPMLFPDREAQVRNIHYDNMDLTVDLANQPEGVPVQQAVRIYSEDVGSVDNILFSNIIVRTVCDGPCDWSDEDQPKELLQIKRAGLLCEHFVTDPDTGEFVSDGFTQIGISHRNYRITVEDCEFHDNTASFIRAFYVESTEQQNETSDDVNDVAADNYFQTGLPVIWQVIPDGIHDG